MTTQPAPDERVLSVDGSRRLHDRAQAVIPHGVSSFARMRRQPLFFSAAAGSHLTDVDGNDYVDCVLGLGPLFLGHRHPEVVAAVTAVMGKVDLTAGQTVLEVELAERIAAWIPCADKVLFTGSGSEAVQVALRVARATTGRSRILKFEGHYHGWIDPVYANAPGAPAGREASGFVEVMPNVNGRNLPENELTVTTWNNISALEEVMREVGNTVAAVIMEPIPFNFGSFLPQSGYLAAVKEICRRYGALLIFDEVVSGFRIHPGGAQALLGVTPDIACFAKAVASGYPMAFVTGTDDAMRSAVSGPVHHAGTFNASPLGMAAGLATTEILGRDSGAIYLEVEEQAARLEEGLAQVAINHDLPLTFNRVGSVMQAFWGVLGPVGHYDVACRSDTETIATLFESVTRRGVHASSRGLLYTSSAHTPRDIDRVVETFDEAVGEVIGELANR